MENSRNILVGDRVFYFEKNKGLQEPAVSGFGLVLEIVHTRDSKKYSRMPDHSPSSKHLQVAVILCDETGELEEQLIKDCTVQENW